MIKKSISPDLRDRQTTSSSPAVSSESSPGLCDRQATSSPPVVSSEPSHATTQTAEEDHVALLFASSNENEDDIYYDNSNAITTQPVERGDITFGSSTRGGKMIFMNQYGYLYMNETKTTVDWRCVKRNENCKAVIYTVKSSGEFSHGNGKYHCHLLDLSDTRKREILTKIKNRVLDEFIPIKSIIEDEYRKANLSNEEKKAMPLPVKIGI